MGEPFEAIDEPLYAVVRAVDLPVQWLVVMLVLLVRDHYLYAPAPEVPAELFN